MKGPSTRAPRGEEGSALILALVFITTIAVMVTAVLSFSDFGFRISLRSREQRARDYAADGAMEAAINKGICTNYSEDQLPQLNNAGKVTVSCGPATDAVAVGGANRPRRAVLALGSGAGEDGIRQLSGSGPLVTKGGIFSRTTVKNDNNSDDRSLIVQGDVSAVGKCDGSIVATLTPLHCADQDGGAADAADGTDPNYPKAINDVPPPASVPSCPGWLVELNPGTYSDAVALSDLTRAGGPCSGKVVRLKPGAYYFDFNADGSKGDCVADANRCTWRINDPAANVVGGTPKGWVADPAAATRAVVPAPGGCQTDQDTLAINSGVQLVFGGQSRLDVAAGKMELCAQPSATAQQTAIYGLKESTGVPSPPVTATPDATTVALTPSANAFQVGDSLTAGADLASSSSVRIGALALTGFDPGFIPAGSTLDGATMRIAHADNGAISRLRATVTHAGGGGPIAIESGGPGCATVPASTSLCVHSTLTTDAIDLKALGIASVDALSGLAVTYESFLAAGNATGNEALDGIAIDVAYTPPGGTGQVGTLSPSQPAGLVPLSPPANALQIGESGAGGPFTANAALAAGSGTATLTLIGYDVPAIPAGSRLDSVRLRVAHGDNGEIDRLRATVVRPNAPVIAIDSAGSGPGCDPTLSLCVHPGLGTDSIDLQARGINSVAALSGLAVSYEAFLAAGGASGSEALDGIAIDVTYTPPTLRALEGCLTAPYPSAPGSCALVRTAGADTKLFVQGTVYAPTAALDISMANVNAPVLGRGVIARSVRLGVTPVAGYTGPTVAVPSNKPRRAVLTLGNDPAEQGIHQLKDSGPLVAKGGIFSRSTIKNDDENGDDRALVVQGDVSAVGDCDGRIKPQPVRCANKSRGAADPADGADPGYAKATETLPPPASVPSCPAGWLVELNPGTYGNAAALSNLTKAGGPCEGKVVRLKPGNYHFDFNADGSQGDCATDPNLCTWKIDDAGANVVGGTPKGWVADPAAPTRPPVPAPGGCQTDQDTLAADTGVQLIFGGQSHLNVSAGKVELCAQPSATAQQIALYGLKQATPAPASSSVLVPRAAGVPLSPSASAFQIGDSSTADASLATASSVTSSALALTGFNPSAIPADATVNSVELRVRHADTGDVDRLQATVTRPGAPAVVIGSGPSCELCVHTAPGDDTVDLKSKGIDSPSALSGLGVSYEAFLATGADKAGSEALDGVAIVVTYTPAGGGSAETTTLTPSGPEGLVPLSTPANAFQIGESPTPLTSDATLATGGATAAGLTLAGYDAGAIPPGSILNSVVLRLRHGDIGDIGRLRTTVTRPDVDPIVIESGASPCDPTKSLCVHAAPAVDTIDLKGLGIDNVGALAGLGVGYEALLSGGSGKAAAESLDGIAIDVTYTPPSFRALSGCVTAAPYPTTAGSCALVKTTRINGSDPKMFVQGTVYAPTAALDVSMANVGGPVFGRGVIARTLQLGITPSGCYGGPIATVLDDPPGEEIGPGVVFTVCIDGVPRLRAKVVFPLGSPAVRPKVKAWSVLR